MTPRLEAYVLLNGPWKPDAGEFATVLEARYPGIGRVRGDAPEEGSGMPTVFTVDGAAVQVSMVGAPYPPEQLEPPMRLLEHVDTEEVARAHVAYMMISTEWTASDDPDDAGENAEMAAAYAALLTLVTATVAEEAPALAAFWTESWRFVSIDEIKEAAAAVMRGEPPLSLWYALAEVKGARAGGGDMRGMMSFGLRAFCGREIEVAPAPLSAMAAQGIARDLAERIFAGDLPEDHAALPHDALEAPAVLRHAERFMRPQQPVALIVPPGASIDVETLEPKRSGGGNRGGLVSRFFSAGSRR
ncbi:MAG: hypothetical protein AAF675_14940 [Pseudomonadota bacterium]